MKTVPDTEMSNLVYRSTNIELCRIIMMLWIVAHHLILHGTGEPGGLPLLNLAWIKFLRMGGRLGVDVFIIISGYYLIHSQEVRIEKIIQILLQLFTYSILLFLLFGKINDQHLSLGTIIKNVMPLLIQDIGLLVHILSCILSFRQSMLF